MMPKAADCAQSPFTTLHADPSGFSVSCLYRIPQFKNVRGASGLLMTSYSTVASGFIKNEKR
jgi:hypothetical protein